MRLPRRLVLLALAGAGLTYVRKVHRYRDPVRAGEEQPGELLCPADGRVSFVRHIDQGHAEELPWRVAELFREEVPAQGWLVGIHISPLDVHYTYAPATGTLRNPTHVPGAGRSFGAGHLLALAAQQPADLLDTPATRENERLVYTLDTPGGAVHVAAIGARSGLRATSYLGESAEVRAGRKTLFLPEGGLVAAYFPLHRLPQVRVGERVVGGQTVMARAG